MTRSEALAKLESLGVPLGESGDVRELKRAILVSTNIRGLVVRYETQCAGKRRYPTEEAARRFAKRFVAGAKPFTEQYPCPHCGYWHNGNPPRGRGGR